MKGLFIPGITAEMFRNGSLESIEELMAEGEFYDIDHPTESEERKTGKWIHMGGDEWVCSECGFVISTEGSWEHPKEIGEDFCKHCGTKMEGATDDALHKN